LYACNFAPVTPTYAVNVSVVCYGWILQAAARSIMHSTNFTRGMNRNCQIREICTSAHMLSNSIQPFGHEPAQLMFTDAFATRE